MRNVVAGGERHGRSFNPKCYQRFTTIPKIIRRNQMLADQFQSECRRGPNQIKVLFFKFDFYCRFSFRIWYTTSKRNHNYMHNRAARIHKSKSCRIWTWWEKQLTTDQIQLRYLEEKEAGLANQLARALDNAMHASTDAMILFEEWGLVLKATIEVGHIQFTEMVLVTMWVSHSFASLRFDRAKYNFYCELFAIREAQWILNGLELSIHSWTYKGVEFQCNNISTYIIPAELFVSFENLQCTLAFKGLTWRHSFA